MTKQLLIFFLLLLVPNIAFGASDDLLDVFSTRPDLQAAFDAETLQAIPGTAAGFLIDLEDWASQYGWQTYAELVDYAPVVAPANPSIHTYPEPQIRSLHYVVMDDASGQILAAKDAAAEWPIASLTKLVTTKTALDYGLDVGGKGTVLNIDNVGGARLMVDDGTLFTIRDLLYATLVGSANNAANAIARLTGYGQETFMGYMNAFATSLNLSHTYFVDPTGIELGNISTAREVAYLAHEVFEQDNIRRMVGTSRIHIEALNDTSYIRDIKNTNWLLYDPAYDEVYVTAGKTGYLDESGWNLVVRMHPMGESEDKSVLIVLLGSEGRRESFDDAHTLADWAWNNFDWNRE
ncbi:MAG: serine hydrolase [Candidatus Uhrbacteria bacterium]|nr:serine hydrolase [Candidatus Uhrbacteria bacterium]